MHSRFTLLKCHSIIDTMLVHLNTQVRKRESASIFLGAYYVFFCDKICMNSCNSRADSTQTQLAGQCSFIQLKSHQFQFHSDSSVMLMKPKLVKWVEPNTYFNPNWIPLPRTGLVYSYLLLFSRGFGASAAFQSLSSNENCGKNSQSTKAKS